MEKLCAHITKDICRRRDCSFEDIATWLSATEDELDIFREATMNDIVKEDQLDLPMPFVPLCPIFEFASL